MTVQVWAACPACGVVPAAWGRILVVEPVTPERDGRWGCPCPSCGRQLWHEASPQARATLARGGATVIPASEDAARVLPGFTEADVEAFAAILAGLGTAPDVTYGQPRTAGGLA